MGAMEINKSGTTARDGLSGGVDRGDAILVGIIVRGLSSGLGPSAQQALDLRQGGQNALLWPCRNLFKRELQQGGQVFVAGHTELGAERALTHPAVNLCTKLLRSLTGGTSRIWPENVGPQLMARYAGRKLNRNAALCRNAPAVVPTRNGWRLDTKKLGKRLLAACRLNCSIEGCHVHIGH